MKELTVRRTAPEQPCRLDAGLGELQAFLERGFDAFRTMRDVSEFVDSIVSREREFSAKLFYGGTQLA